MTKGLAEMEHSREQVATAIALRLYPLTETSLIVHWLTAEQGRVATVAKGARRVNSPFRGKLDIFFKVQMSYLRSVRSELHTLKEVKLLDGHGRLRQEPGNLQQAAYAAALVEQVTEKETPLPGFYRLFEGLLGHLAQARAEAQTVFAFELKVLDELGLNPTLIAPDPVSDMGAARPRPAVSAGAEQMIARMTTGDWTDIGRLKLSPQQIKEIRQWLHGFLIYHLGKYPESRTKALEGRV